MRLSATLRPVTRLTGSLGVATITTFGDATALVTDILAPKTAYIATGKVTGTCTFDADTSDATAAESDILLGKTAYAGGVELTGTCDFNATVTNGVKITQFDESMNPQKAEVIGDNVWRGTFMSLGAGNLSWDELLEVSAPNATTLHGSAFHSLLKLTSLSLPSAVSIGAYSIYLNPSLTSLSLPEVTAADGYFGINGNAALETISLPKCTTTSNTRPLGNNMALTSCQIGSIGYPVTSMGSTTFQIMTQLGLTITIYVTPETQPLANSPWGATNATIVYRSAVDGSVL